MEHQQTGPSIHCLEMKHYARDQMLNLTLQTTQIPATLLPSSSIFIPLFLEGPKLECIFNAGMHFPAVEICRRLVIEAQQPGPYSQPARRCFACMHALSCKYKERAVAEFPTASFKSEAVLTQRCWVLGYWGVRAKFSGVQ